MTWWGHCWAPNFNKKILDVIQGEKRIHGGPNSPLLVSYFKYNTVWWLPTFDFDIFYHRLNSLWYIGCCPRPGICPKRTQLTVHTPNKHSNPPNTRAHHVHPPPHPVTTIQTTITLIQLLTHTPNTPPLHLRPNTPTPTSSDYHSNLNNTLIHL